MQTDAEWIAQQTCCIPDCSNQSVAVDDMDHPHCNDHMEQGIDESPEDWQQYLDETREEPFGQPTQDSIPPKQPTRLFNTSELHLDMMDCGKNILIVPQKKASIAPKPYYMCLINKGRDIDIWMNRRQLEQLHRHIGGLLALEVDSGK